MAYTKYTYRCGIWKETVIMFRGERGAKKERCGPRRKRTDAEIARQNLTNKINRLRRLIRCNFQADDYWMDLTFKIENRKPP